MLKNCVGIGSEPGLLQKNYDLVKNGLASCFLTASKIILFKRDQNFLNHLPNGKLFCFGLFNSGRPLLSKKERDSERDENGFVVGCEKFE